MQMVPVQVVAPARGASARQLGLHVVGTAVLTNAITVTMYTTTTVVVSIDTRNTRRV